MRRGSGDSVKEAYVWSYATTCRTSYIDKKVSVKPYTRNYMLHVMLKMEYIMLMILALEMYYLMHHFQIYLRVGITLPMMGTHITKRQFLSMWTIDDLEWREYLTYNIVCYYIQYHQLKRFNALEF
jgi:hypothetical protein